MIIIIIISKKMAQEETVRVRCITVPLTPTMFKYFQCSLNAVLKLYIGLGSLEIG